MAEKKSWDGPRQLVTQSLKISPWGVEAINTSLLASLTGILMSNLNPSGAKDRAEAVTGRGFHNRGQKRHEYGTSNEKVAKVLNKNLKKGQTLHLKYCFDFFFSREDEHYFISYRYQTLKIKGFFSPFYLKIARQFQGFYLKRKRAITLCQFSNWLRSKNLRRFHHFFLSFDIRIPIQDLDPYLDSNARSGTSPSECRSAIPTKKQYSVSVNIFTDKDPQY
jgi:hypothetical protein